MFKQRINVKGGWSLDEVLLLEELQSSDAEMSVSVLDVVFEARSLHDEILVLVDLFLVVGQDLLLALLAQNSLAGVHSVVVGLVLGLSFEEMRVVDVFLLSLLLQVLVEEELLFLVVGETSVQDFEVSDELHLGEQIAIVGVDVTESRVRSSSVVV